MVHSSPPPVLVAATLPSAGTPAPRSRYRQPECQTLRFMLPTHHIFRGEEDGTGFPGHPGRSARGRCRIPTRTRARGRHRMATTRQVLPPGADPHDADRGTGRASRRPRVLGVWVRLHRDHGRRRWMPPGRSVDVFLRNPVHPAGRGNVPPRRPSMNRADGPCLLSQSTSTSPRARTLRSGRQVPRCGPTRPQSSSWPVSAGTG